MYCILYVAYTACTVYCMYCILYILYTVCTMFLMVSMEYKHCDSTARRQLLMLFAYHCRTFITVRSVRSDKCSAMYVTYPSGLRRPKQAQANEEENSEYGFHLLPRSTTEKSERYVGENKSKVTKSNNCVTSFV